MNNELKIKSIEEMKEELKRISDFDKIQLINAILFSNSPLFISTESNKILSYLIEKWGYDCNVVNLRKEIDDTIKNELPNWYIKFKSKCNDEPEKFHLIFFDEIENSTSEVQRKVINIILDNELNNEEKLPENAGLIIPINKSNKTIFENNMFAKFPSIDIYYSWTDVIEYYVSKNIHPAIVFYLFYRYREAIGTPPSWKIESWELASKVLYKTQIPLAIRPFVGKNEAIAFDDFCYNKHVLNLEDILYSNNKLNLIHLSEETKYATAMNLLDVDEEHFETVKEFLNDMNEKICDMFDIIWKMKNKDKIKKLDNVKIR